MACAIKVNACVSQDGEENHAVPNCARMTAEAMGNAMEENASVNLVSKEKTAWRLFARMTVLNMEAA